MKKIDAFFCGITSISCISASNYTDVLKKFPSSYEKTIDSSLQKSWQNVGNSIKGAIDKYESSTKKVRR